MRVTKRQLRRIIREEEQRDLPIEFYSDEALISEGLLDWLGNLFGGLVDFFTGGAKEAEQEATSGWSSGVSSNLPKAAEEEGEEEITSVGDLDLEDDTHKKIFFNAAAPVEAELMKSVAGEISKAGSGVTDWTPKSDSEEDQNAWKEGDGKAALGLWDAVGHVGGSIKMYVEAFGKDWPLPVPSMEDAVSSGNPGEAVKFIMAACNIIKKEWDKASSDLGVDAGSVISAAEEAEGAAKTVGEAIAESGKEQQQEWVDLRRWVSSTILQEGKGSSKMRITKGQLRRIIREETVKSTEKYDDDSALKGDQDELPDALQKGIIDKTVEEREEEEKKDESIRITRRHLRRIIREALTAVNMETGEVWEAEPLGIPDKAWPNLVKRLNLNPQAGSGGVDDYDLSEEDFRKLAAETEYKQQGRSRAAESKRLDGDRITDELVTWATDAGTQFAADNPGVDIQAAAYDLAQSGRNQVSPDEWEAAVWYMFDENGGYLVDDNSYEAAEEALETMLADAAAVGGG